MRALVTGSTGFIGARLCRALLAEGHEVRAFHRSTSAMRLLENLPVEHAAGDLTRPESLVPALEGVQVVFHSAALIGAGMDPGRAHAVTVEGTRSLLSAALQAGVERVVHTSSAAALGMPSSGQLLNEHAAWNLPPEAWTYGYAKYQAELEVQRAVAQGLDVVIVNPAYVLGPGDVYRQTTSLVVRVANGRLPALVDGGVSVVHVDDIAAGHLAAWKRGRRGERYLLGGENLTIEQLVGLIADVAGVPAPAVVLPSGLVRSAAGTLRWLEPLVSLPVTAQVLRMAGNRFWVDSRKARTELGLPPPLPARQAVQDAYDWFAAAGAIRRSRSSSG